MANVKQSERAGGDSAPESSKTLTFLPEKERTRAVIREQARLLHGNGKISTYVNAVNGAIVAAAASVSGGIALAVILPWFAFLLTVVAIRALLIAHYPDRHDDADALVHWLRHFTWANAGVGLAWGVTAAGLYFAKSPWVGTLIVFVIAGMSAGAAAVNGVYARAAIGFLLAALSPFLVYFIVATVVSSLATVEWAMVPLTLIYLVVLVRVALNVEKTIRETVALREEKALMARQLETSLREARRNEEELAAGKRQYEKIADNSFAWESLFSEDGGLQWVNAAVERITGYSVADCRLMADYPLPIIHKKDRARVRNALASAQNRLSRQSMSFRFVRKDGTVRRGAVVSMPVRDENGQGRGFRATVFDVTEEEGLSRGLVTLDNTDGPADQDGI